MTKASDLRSLFGAVSQHTPLYLHTPLRRNLPVPGVKSDRLKFKALLCPRCNNERTQPHDRAWEMLSHYLRERQPSIRTGTVVNLASAFPGSVKQSMLDVHLYFLKLFGCLIVEHVVPLDITPFSAAILEGHAHPKVFIAFWAEADRRFHRFAGQSPIETAQVQGRIAFATWFYEVGRLAVNVMYAEPGQHRRGLTNAWHPASIAKRIRIGGQ